MSSIYPCKALSDVGFSFPTFHVQTMSTIRERESSGHLRRFIMRRLFKVLGESGGEVGKSGDCPTQQ